MEKMKITLKTKSPIVLSGPGNATLLTVTRDVFSGTTLRGLIAARYIVKKGLGAAAHQDADFRRLFFGGVRFVDAYPEINGKVSFPLPASLQKKKDANEIRDLLCSSPEKGFKAFRGLAVKDGDNLARIFVKKSMTLHMSRNGEIDTAGAPNAQKISDNIERLSGKSENGGIYTYESISEGQTFVGFLIGDTEDLSSLKETLGDCWNGRAGRSKYAEYGEIECVLDSPEPISHTAPAPTGIGVWLYLQTPFLPLEDNAASAKQTLTSAVANEMNRRRGGNSFSVGKIFANVEPADSFVAVWRLRRPRQTALSAGSCFVLEKTGNAWDEADMAALHALMHEGIGLRTEEGFGQLRFWEKKAWIPGGMSKNTALPQKQIANHEVKTLAANILCAKGFEQLRLYAAADVRASAVSISKQPVHFFRQLEEMFRAAGFKNAIATKLNEKKTAFYKHLEETRISLPGGKRSRLSELMKLENLSLPYKGAERLEEFNNQMSELYQMLGSKPINAEEDKVIQEYWKWFFRHARKTKNVGKEAADK